MVVEVVVSQWGGHGCVSTVSISQCIRICTCVLCSVGAILSS